MAAKTRRGECDMTTEELETIVCKHEMQRLESRLAWNALKLPVRSRTRRADS